MEQSRKAKGTLMANEESKKRKRKSRRIDGASPIAAEPRFEGVDDFNHWRTMLLPHAYSTMKDVQEALNRVRGSLDAFKKIESLAKEAYKRQIRMKELTAQCTSDESRLKELNSTLTELQKEVKETQATFKANKKLLAQQETRVEQIVSQFGQSGEGTLESFNQVKVDVTDQWTKCKRLYDELFDEQSISHPREVGK
ncbi:hypothetical protein Dimus_029692 [Dionaea muscipula]